jgi:hypothetical protein
MSIAILSNSSGKLPKEKHTADYDRESMKVSLKMNA